MLTPGEVFNKAHDRAIFNAGMDDDRWNMCLAEHNEDLQ